VLQEIRDKIAGAGGTIEFRQQIECTFPAREVSATVSDRQRVERAIAQFYGEA
jgi:predicted component of type VI protein secretion system